MVKVGGLEGWAAFDHYRPGLYGTTGNRYGDPLNCFKMLPLEQWYGLSDPKCEARCADRLSFQRLLGLSLSDRIPDETVPAQVEAAGVMIKRGTLVDATIVQSARKAPPRAKWGAY